MSNEEAIANLVGLMTSFHLEIKTVPDKLKCAKCKSVLKNACQMPCGCRFCRACIDDVISRGDQFCPGGSQECGATPLSTALPDYRANKNVLKLIAKCPHGGCTRECPLADMEGHMRVCLGKNIDCPFRELGCAQGALPGDEMSGHLLQESRGHSEILIGTVANMSRDMEMLKRELLLKDEQAIHREKASKSIMDEIKSMKEEMKSMKIENESKREKEVLIGPVRQLAEKLEREIAEWGQSDERDSAMVTAVTAAVASNRDETEPMPPPVEPSRVDASLNEWVIDIGLGDTDWAGGESGRFSGGGGGEAPCYSHVLQAANSAGVEGASLRVHLLVVAGPHDSRLDWPFCGEVTVTVANRDGPEEASSYLTRLCRIERPPDNRYRCRHDAPFEFRHAALRGAGLDLSRGVRLSCRIAPGQEEMSGHSEVVIDRVANISTDTEVLLKDEQARHRENAMKSIMAENESIKRDKEAVCDRVRQLAEKLEREIFMFPDSHERNISMVMTVMEAVSSIREALGSKMKPVRGDIPSIGGQSDRMKFPMESIQLDNWLIKEDVAKTEWGGSGIAKTSGKFGAGGGHPLTFELASLNYVGRGELWISLRIWAGPGDPVLPWPFRCEVTVTIADRDRRDACSRRALQCEIGRPPDNQYNVSAIFQFPHSALRGAGLDLSRGVNVSCRIVPGRSSDAVSLHGSLSTASSV